MSADSNWDKVYRERAERRLLSSNPLSTTIKASRLAYELFVGVEGSRYREVEPSFATLLEAIKWARGNADGAPWRIRSTLTGALLFEDDKAILGPWQSSAP